MTDELEARMHEAFDQAHMPAGLAERTLARIEAERQRTGGGDAARKAHAPVQETPQSTAHPSFAVVDEPARRKARRHRRAPLVAALAACLVLAALGIGGVAWAWQPYAYVAIDVNPSVELGINRFDRVASTRAYNDDGAQVLKEADVDGMVYEDAIDALDDALRTYLQDGAVVQMTVVCSDEAAASELETVGTRCLDAGGTGQVHCSHASEEEHRAAASAGIGIGKYRVWQELVDAGVDITADEASAMTMRELLGLAGAEGVDTSTPSTGAAEGEHRGAETHHAGSRSDGADGESGGAGSISSPPQTRNGHSERHRANR